MRNRGAVRINPRRNAQRGSETCGRSGPTAEEFVQKCLAEKGDEYEKGGEYAPGTSPGRTREWDCSGLVYTKLQELGIDPPRTSTAQLNWCRENRTIIPLEQAIRTRGALLLREGHVAVSLGDGHTIEALGDEWGVGIFSATSNRTFTHGGLVPGLTYGGDRVLPAQDQPSPPPPTITRPTLRRGSSGSHVRSLQLRLKELDYNPGAVDGIFGSRTEQTVKDFQASRGLTADGIVGRQTWAALS